MGAGFFIEPAVVITLLFGGTWINRSRTHSEYDWSEKDTDAEIASPASWSSSNPLIRRDGDIEQSSFPTRDATSDANQTWRSRDIYILGWKGTIATPNTDRFRDRLISRIFRKFPFLVEVIYWALIYWIYQLGRAFTAVTIVEGTVYVARHHALAIIHYEQMLRIFWELEIQAWFLQKPLLMLWTNRLYSFIHIPGTIAFLVCLYHYTTVQNRTQSRSSDAAHGSPSGPLLYEARRRTMALCNVLAFIIFTAWPCMPPRLLSDPRAQGKDVAEALRYPFVDTVHGEGGEASVWTENRFVNHYAAMPSLHFGYSLLVGLTIAIVPLAPRHRAGRNRVIALPSRYRMLCILIGFAYPFSILAAIIATANHFILDAAAGACICALAWFGNRFMLNLLPLEDCVLWCLRVHKPEGRVVEKGVIQES